MASKLKLEIVTPDAKTYSEDVEMVTLPGAEGEMGIYPMHVPLMTQIVAGEISVRKDGRDFFLAVGDGFAAITGDSVSVMTDMAIKAENIDEAKAEEARRRAKGPPSGKTGRSRYCNGHAGPCFTSLASTQSQNAASVINATITGRKPPPTDAIPQVALVFFYRCGFSRGRFFGFGHFIFSDSRASTTVRAMTKSRYHL